MEHEPSVEGVLRYLNGHLDILYRRPAGDLAADKCACEIALLCWGIRRRIASEASLDALTRPLLDWAESRLRAPSVVAALMWQPTRLHMLAMGSAFLDGLGRRAPAFSSAVLATWRGGFQGLAERSPYQELEVHFTTKLAGWEPAERPLQHWFAARPFLPLMTVDDGYALTHAIFYLTGFGRTGIPIDCDVPAVHQTIEIGLWWCLWRRDLDLLAELLLCALFVEMPTTMAFSIASNLLMAYWKVAGHLSADHDSSNPDGRNSVDASDIEQGFFAHYHPLLVGGLLASEIAGRVATPARELSVQDFSSPDVAALLGVAGHLGQIRAHLKDNMEHALRAHYGAEVVENMNVLFANPPTEDWRVILGFVDRDALQVTAGVFAQLETGSATRCTHTALQWLGTLAPIAEAMKATARPNS